MTVTAFILGTLFGAGCGIFGMAMVQVNRDNRHNRRDGKREK